MRVASCVKSHCRLAVILNLYATSRSTESGTPRSADGSPAGVDGGARAWTGDSDTRLGRPVTRRIALVGLSWISADLAGDAADPTLGTAIPYSHASAIAAIPDLEIVAGCDISGGARDRVPRSLVDRAGRTCKVYADYREMLETERPELVAVVTPDHLHAAVVEAAVEAGVRGIFCEKPLATTLEEADAIIAAVRGAGVTMNVNYTRRWYPEFVEARRLVRDGALGPLSQIVVQMGGPRSMLFRNHTHAIDLINFLADANPVWVWAELERGFEEYGTAYAGDGGNDPATEPGANYYIAYDNGVRAYLTGMKDTVGLDTSVSLTGPEARLVVDLEGIRLHSVLPRGHPHETRRHRRSSGSSPRWTVAGMQAAVLDLITAMDEGRDPASPPEAARQTVAITQAILESQARGNVKVQLSEFAPARSAPPADRQAPLDQEENHHASCHLSWIRTAPRAPGSCSERAATNGSSTSPTRHDGRVPAGRPPGPARGRTRCARRRSRSRGEPAPRACRSAPSSSSPRSGGPASCSPSPATSRRTSRKAAARASTRRRSCPKLFIKPSSAIIGPGEAVALPTVSDALDWELELAIVIGTARARHPGRQGPRPRRGLLGHQRHLGPLDAVGRATVASRSGFDDFFDWLNGKWGDGFAAWGPWITTTDAVQPDPNELEMTLKVNDKVWQHGSTADMIFSPEEIIAFASRFMTLEPGDVIAGGTLDGTGDAAGVYLKAGDVMDGHDRRARDAGHAGRRGAAPDRGRASPVRGRRVRVHGPDLGPGHRGARPGGDAWSPVAGGRGAADLARQHGVEPRPPRTCSARDDIDAVVDRHARADAIGRSPRPPRGPGKHVLVEKPMTNTRADADAMVAAADAAGVRLAVVSQHRFRGAPMAARAAIEAGRIGDDPDDPGLRPERRAGTSRPDSWNSDRAQVSPYMDWGAHACDIVRWLTGAEATLAFAQFASYTDVPPTDQSSMAHYTLDGGVMVQIWLTYELPEPSLGSAMQLLITGSDGIIELDSYGTVRLGHAGRWLGDHLRADAVRSARRRTIRSGCRPTPRSCATSCAAIAEGRDPSVSGRQGALTTSMLEAAERSAASGQIVRLPLQRLTDAPEPAPPAHRRGTTIDRHAPPLDVAVGGRDGRPHPAVRLRRVLRRVRAVRPPRPGQLLPGSRAASASAR